MLFLIWLVPLAGAIVNWAFGPQLKRAAGIVGCAALAMRRSK